MNSNNDLCNLVAQFRSFIREFFLWLFLVLPYIFFFIISHQKMFLSFISVFAFWVSFVINSSVLCEVLAQGFGVSRTSYNFQKNFILFCENQWFNQFINCYLCSKWNSNSSALDLRGNSHWDLLRIPSS